MATIHDDWKEFLLALQSERTRFLLISGALERFGFGGMIAEAAAFATPDRVFMLGVKPWRIDILTGIDGVTFAEAWATRVPADFHGIRLDVIGRDALLANKRASGRRKDLFDAALLEEAARDDERERRIHARVRADRSYRRTVVPGHDGSERLGAQPGRRA